tara:strand:+ start:132 stop:386 length:255 start_codon:yes stop_codon:yes gene_type:complete
MYEYHPECYNMDQCDKYMPTPLFEKGHTISNPLLEPEIEPEVLKTNKCNIFSDPMKLIFPFENKNNNFILLLFIVLCCVMLFFT